MNTTLAPGLRRFVIVFFDDILIYSRSYEEQVQHVAQVFQWLAADQWKIKVSKCKFAQRSVAYLGHIISGEGLATDPAKVKAIQDWPTPTSVRALRGFLGLAEYYRKFVRNFGIIATPLTQLLKKDVVFVWTTVHDTAFQSLKSALSAAPVLALPDFSVPFEVETDASGSGIGAVLQQHGHPLAYISKALGPRNQGLFVYEKEYLAILMAVDSWRHYLLQSEFIIHTDQKSLIHLNEQRLHTPWQQKVFTQLLGLRYRIVYRCGADNTVADALSRCPHPKSLMALSAPMHDWMSTLQQWHTQDNEASSLLAQLPFDPAGRPPFTLRQGIIMYIERIWLGSNLELQRQVLAALHNNAVRGHSGAPATMAKVRQLFYWSAMKNAVWQFVQSCAVCAQAKPDRSSYPGLLQPLSVIKQSWEVISMVRQYDYGCGQQVLQVCPLCALAPSCFSKLSCPCLPA